jgi:hypothetical protein
VDPMSLLRPRGDLASALKNSGMPANALHRGAAFRSKRSGEDCSSALARSSALAPPNESREQNADPTRAADPNPECAR